MQSRQPDIIITQAIQISYNFIIIQNNANKMITITVNKKLLLEPFSRSKHITDGRINQ